MTATVSASDCLSFACDALTARGALVEREAEGALVVLPADLARDLDAPESCSLTLESAARDGDTVSVAFGAPLLERLVEWSRSLTPVAACRLESDPPRPAQARRLAEQLIVRNGVAEVVDVGLHRAAYWFGWLAWTAECDERYEGILQVALCEDDGAEPEATLADASTLLSATRADPMPIHHPSELDALRLARTVATRAAAAISGPIGPICASVERRKRRDHERIVSYFDALAAEALRARGKARVDRAALEKKLAAFAAERDAKLRDLDIRFDVRVSFAPAALLRVEIPAAHVELRLKRRKSERTFRVRLPAGAKTIDRPTCDACRLPCSSVALCDDRLHLICERCLPDARGRPSCARCRS